MGSQLVGDDDLRLLHDAVRNVDKLSGALNDLTIQLMQTSGDVVLHVKYDDRIARALESIADTLSRLERS